MRQATGSMVINGLEFFPSPSFVCFCQANFVNVFSHDYFLLGHTVQARGIAALHAHKLRVKTPNFTQFTRA